MRPTHQNHHRKEPTMWVNLYNPKTGQYTMVWVVKGGQVRFGV